MNIREDIAVLHALKADHKSQTALTAINDGISALMTIEDMRFYVIPPVNKEPATVGFDIKHFTNRLQCIVNLLANIHLMKCMK